MCSMCINTAFCWKCGGIWKNKISETYYCGNDDCDNFESEYFEILSECQLKKIGSVDGCPSIRSCPKCSQLLNHTECCKHLKCPRCKINFCFVCLKQMIGGDWQCGDSSSICPIAPKQTLNIGNNSKLLDVSEWGDWY